MSAGMYWKVKPHSSRAAGLARELGLSPLQTQLLINRGIVDSKSARIFLNPRLAELIDPRLLKDMDRAVELIIRAVDHGRRITVYGDYDADGLTATALMVNFLSELGARVGHYIPHRIEEGYGLNAVAVRNLADSGTDLLITVDCGISDFEEISLAKRLGMEVIVTDHHRIPEAFETICPTINPHQPGCPFPYKDLTGVGLCFSLAIALRAGMRERGWFSTSPEPDLRDYLDLVALGTVADRAPLCGQNRILVKNGIDVMAGTRWAGMKALMDVAGVGDSLIEGDDLAFRLAPRLNAPGRMGDASIGVEMLRTRHDDIARELSLGLDKANRLRQELERKILEEIEETIQGTLEIDDSKTLVMAKEDWHQGVLGIVASRLVDKYRRPALVFAIQDGLAVGSGRSTGGFDLYSALSQFQHLFERFGGHAHAAGLALKVERLEMFKEELEGLAWKSTPDQGDWIDVVEADAELSIDDINFEMLNEIKVLSPFGEGNPEPLFLSRSVKVLEEHTVGERHLRLRVGQGEKGLEAIGFGLAGRDSLQGKLIDILFTPELNRWKGRETIRLRLRDLRAAG